MYLPGGIIRTDGLAAIRKCMFRLGVEPPSHLPLGVRDPLLTQCVIEPHKCKKRFRLIITVIVINEPHHVQAADNFNLQNTIETVHHKLEWDTVTVQ